MSKQTFIRNKHWGVILFVPFLFAAAFFLMGEMDVIALDSEADFAGICSEMQKYGRVVGYTPEQAAHYQPYCQL